MDPKSNVEDDETVASASATTSEKKKPNYPGPKSGVQYPLNVLYCGECNLPVDLCEFTQNPEACKEWLEKNHPDFSTKMNELKLSENAQNEASNDGNEKKSSHQKRGGKAIPKSKKEKVPSKIIIQKNQRKGNKYVTIITGLAANDIDLEVAKKFFATKFSCGCSKGAEDELIIQGDVVDSLFDVIPEKFPQINQDMIEEKEK